MRYVFDLADLAHGEGMSPIVSSRLVGPATGIDTCTIEQHVLQLGAELVLAPCKEERLLLLVAGECRVETGGLDRLLQAGSSVFMPASCDGRLTSAGG